MRYLYKILFFVVFSASWITGCAAAGESDAIQDLTEDSESIQQELEIEPEGSQQSNESEEVDEVEVQEEAPTENQEKDDEKDSEAVENKDEVDTDPVSVNEVWSVKFGGNQDDTIQNAIPTEDGGFYLLGTTNKSWEPIRKGDLNLIKMNADGEVDWEKFFPGEPWISGEALIITEDGNLLIGGIVQTEDTQSIDVFLKKVNSQGEEIWMKTFQGEMDEWINSIELASDGGYILMGNIVDPEDFITDPGAAGYGGFSHRSNFYMMKTNELGEVEWSKHFESEENIVASGGMATSDGEFVLLGTILYYPDPLTNQIAMKIDEDGQETWTHIWEDGGTSVRGFSISGDDHIVVSGSYSLSADPRQGDADIIVTKLELDGTVVWEEHFGEPDQVDLVGAMTTMSDGTFMLVVDRSEDLYQHGSDLFLLKVDADGKQLWEAKVGYEPHFMVSNVIVQEDVAYIAYSMVRYNDFDFYLNKIEFQELLSK
ncbi:MAG: hypothetical protein JEZ06_01545 [Anaerolineaceae bacterium]|nr:hypothetical protein [Anaerolineaceae bacterium]